MRQFVWAGIIFFGFLLGLTLGAFLASRELGLPSLEQAVVTVSPSPSTSAPPGFTIMAVGDVMLGRSVNLRTREAGDYTWPFHLVGETLRSADLTIANLENPVVHECPPHEGGFKFCSPPESVEGLLYAGIDVVSLANNHATNYGQVGLSETVDFLNAAGISSIGLGQPAFFELGRQRIGLLAYNDVGLLPPLSQAEPDLVAAEVASLSATTDLVLVSFHWGEEYTASPSARQIELAHSAVEAGADIVIGHHPHWVQSEEVYRDKPIFYSLGNFVFDQMWSEETKTGLAVRLTYRGSELIRVDRLPVYIENYGQAKWYSGEKEAE